jgi:nucleoside-diphosphate-sugar epimerase
MTAKPTGPSGAADASAASRRRALITGATGFIGSHLARRLDASGWEVDAVLRSDSGAERLPHAARVHRHDGTTEGMVALVAAAQPDVVFHLASLFIAEHKTADVTRLIESNLLLGTQLAEAMRVHARTRLVNTGTVWQHYDDREYSPSSLYAATKQAFVDCSASSRRRPG